MKQQQRRSGPRKIKSLTHGDRSRKNIPTAEMEPLVSEELTNAHTVHYDYRDGPDSVQSQSMEIAGAEPRLVWKGKSAQDPNSLSVGVMPIYVQEKIDPKAIISDLQNQAQHRKVRSGADAPLYSDWPEELDIDKRIEFYQHSEPWTNRMILGDSLDVMTSLYEKEGLRGQVQCIYMDPPYGISYASNWQSRFNEINVKDGNKSFETREPEVVRAFRDTWKDGDASYASYLRSRFLLAHRLLCESGSIFVQIGNQNSALVQLLLWEVFKKENHVSTISYRTKIPLNAKFIPNIADQIVWFAKDIDALKFRKLFEPRDVRSSQFSYVRDEALRYRSLRSEERNSPQMLKQLPLVSGADLVASGYTESCHFRFSHEGREHYPPGVNSWKTTPDGMERLKKAGRIFVPSNKPSYAFFKSDYPMQQITNQWGDTKGASEKTYVVQTSNKVVQRCLLMSTDPGDLVLDPTCGSGTTAYVAEQWGRRWITIDTSRISLALARMRLMSARFAYYKLRENTNTAGGVSLETPHPARNVNQVNKGFVLKEIPHITLGSIAHNGEIDMIWDRWQGRVDSALRSINAALDSSFRAWEVPIAPDESWAPEARAVHLEWWKTMKQRQAEIDESIRANADPEPLFDEPVKDDGILRVAGPFTVESLSPHRTLPLEAGQEVAARPKSVENGETRFLKVVYECLVKAGVQNTKKGERLRFVSLNPWANGRYVQFEGRYVEGKKEKRVAVYVGPEYGTVTRQELVQAAREASDYFDLLVVLGFAYEPHADPNLVNVGKMPILRARMNHDLHMADDLTVDRSSNVFVVFGEPDIEVHPVDSSMYRAEIKGIDIFDPTTGEVKSCGPKEVACWFVDTNYNGEAFFVRLAYFCGANKTKAFKQLRKELGAEIDAETWETLFSTVSRPFPKPDTGQIAIKAINHYGDEVLKVFREFAQSRPHSGRDV